MGTIKRNFYNNITPTGKFDATDLTGTVPADNITNASLNNVTSVPASVGDFVQKVSSDPTPASAGDVWYNTTSNALKSVVSLEAWSSGSPTNGERRNSRGTGIQTAALAIGGGGGNGPSTEEYNGSGWSFGGTLGTGRYGGGAAGTQTAGLFFGGGPGGSPAPTATEEYDGSTWTAGGALSQGRQGMNGTGTQTAGLAFGGAQYPPAVPSPTFYDVTEEYNGTVWTAGGALNSTRRKMASSGIQTAALSIGGNEPTVALVEEYNGTSWTEVADLNTARTEVSGNGIVTSSLAYGGSTNGSSAGSVTSTEAYDGTSWSNKPSLSTARRLGAGAGASSSSGLYAAGFDASSDDISLTEEYNKSINVITPGAWASGGNMNTARRNFRGSGTQTAALAAGGQSATPPLPDSESYDGSSWSATPSLGTARSSLGMGTGAPSTAAVAFGGYLGPPYPNMSVATEEYNGSSWTASGNLATGRYGMYGFGTQTAAVSAGGDANPVVTSVEEYDGSTWTAGTALGSSRYAGASCGLLTAGLIFGGSAPITVSTEEYDGTSWTTGGNLNSAVGNSRGAGIQTSALSMGGQRPSVTSATEQYNGTSWVTSISMTTARSGMAEAGTSSAALIGAGNPGSSPYNTAATEEFTGETTAANIKTISTS